MIKNYSTDSNEDTCLITEEDLKTDFYMAFSYFSCFGYFFQPTEVTDRLPCTLEITGEVSMGSKQKDKLGFLG